MPSEVFAGDFGVVDGDVLGVPERVFRVYDGIAYLDVAAVLSV